MHLMSRSEFVLLLQKEQTAECWAQECKYTKNERARDRAFAMQLI